jgi:hypothetical protein
VTAYSTSHGSCAGRAVSGSTRGFGPGLRDAKRQAEPGLEHPIHSGRQSGRPLVGARSIRVVVAGSVGMASSAVKSGISVQRRHRCQLVILARELPGCSTMTSFRHGSPTPRPPD